MSFDVGKARKHFPALQQEIGGYAPIFLDGPGGMQVPQAVLDAMTGYLEQGNSNLINSPFMPVQNTHETLSQAREKAAIFVNARGPQEIVFGPTMSAITAHLSRSISKEWAEGDEVIVSALDHYANVSFWQRVAEDRGATCHQIRVDTKECNLDYDHFEELLSPKTKFVAFTLASNLCGTLTDAQRVIQAAQSVGAMTYIDAVHYAPHFLPDAQALDCDFMACSAYKFGGPHWAFVCGKQEHLERLTPYKVEPVTNVSPDCWEMGTKSFEALAGLSAIIDYMDSYHQNNDLRENLKTFYQDVFAHEKAWAQAFLARATEVPGMKIYGITDPDRVSERTATFAFTVEGHEPLAISYHLAEYGIAAGAGNFYAKGITEALGLEEQGGVVRAGCVHYNTLEELDRFFEALEKL